MTEIDRRWALKRKKADRDGDHPFIAARNNKIVLFNTKREAEEDKQGDEFVVSVMVSIDDGAE